MHKKRYKVDLFRFNFSSQKGQVTIFIILGLFLLLVVALIIIFQKEKVIFTPEELTPLQKGKAEDFITACLQTIGDNALFQLGQQGGYIYLPAEVLNDGNAHLKTSPFTVIPYWAYGTSKKIPSLEQIETQIDLYIQQNLRDCLFADQVFQEKYDFVEKSGITANTEIVNSGVIFNVHWILQIKTKDGEIVTEIANHNFKSPVRLKKLYETSTSILNTELAELKLEDLTQDLLALEHPDVPVAGFAVSCDEKKWKLSQVKKTVQDLLRTNLRELKVSGSEYVEFPAELSYYQNHYVWDLGKNFKAPGVSVLFRYENNYPFVFDVRPRSGSYLKSNTLGGKNDLLSFFCLQSWKFVYTVGFPVQVIVTDDLNAYDFKIAFTVHLKDNYPRREDQSLTPLQAYIDTYSDEEYCRQRTVPMLVSTSELVENEQTGVRWQNPLDDVDLSFTCLQYGCELGQTESGFAGMGDISALRTNFPYCVGGILRGKKEGYKEDFVRVVTRDNEEVSLNLIPLYSLPLEKIKVVKRHLRDDGTLGPEMELGQKETVLFTLRFRKNNDLPQQPFHESIQMWSTQLEPSVLAAQKLTFLAEADFTYELDLQVLEESEYIGGFKGNWTVPWNDLKSVQEIIFPVVSKEGASEEEIYELMQGLESGAIIEPLPEIR